MKIGIVKKLLARAIPEGAAAIGRARTLYELETMLIVFRGPLPVEYQVTLNACGPNKIGVIKAVRELTGLGLREAKDLADLADTSAQPVLKTKDLDRAHRAVRLLGDAGAGAVMVNAS